MQQHNPTSLYFHSADAPQGLYYFEDSLRSLYCFTCNTSPCIRRYTLMFWHAAQNGTANQPASLAHLQGRLNLANHMPSTPPPLAAAFDAIIENGPVWSFHNLLFPYWFQQLCTELQFIPPFPELVYPLFERFTPPDAARQIAKEGASPIRTSY